MIWLPERAAKLAPREAGIHASLGGAYLRSNKPRLALAAYRKVIRIQPDPESYVGLGLAQLGQNQRSAAIKSFESFLQMTAGDAAHAARRGLVEAKLIKLREQAEPERSQPPR